MKPKALSSEGRAKRIKNLSDKTLSLWQSSRELFIFLSTHNFEPVRAALFRLILLLLPLPVLFELREGGALEIFRGQRELVVLGRLHDLVGIIAFLFIGMLPLKNRLLKALRMTGLLIFIGMQSFAWAYYSQLGVFPDLSSLEFASAYASTTWLMNFLFSSEKGALLVAFQVGAVLSALLLGMLPRASRLELSFVFFLLAGLLVFESSRKSNLLSGHPFTQATRRQFLEESLGPLATFSNDLTERWGRPVPDQSVITTLQAALRPRPTEATQPPALKRSPPIVLVSIESLRPDAPEEQCDGKPVMPYLQSLLERSAVFERAYAPSTHSDYSDPAIYSSRLPLFGEHHVYFSPSDSWPRPILHTALKPLGYRTAHFSSQNESWGGMRYFLSGIDTFFDPETTNLPTYLDKKDIGAHVVLKQGALAKGNLYDFATIDAALSWVRAQHDARFLLSLNLQTTHFPYTLPPNEEPFCGSVEFSRKISFARYPDDQIPTVRRAYANALASIDKQLQRLVSALPSDTLLVLYGDNGESFGEGGRYSHGGNPFEGQSRVFLALSAPGIIPSQRVQNTVSLLDIAPTIYELLTERRFEDFQGDSLLHSAENTRWMHVDSPIAQADGAVFGGRWKYFFDLKRKVDHLYHLESDPEERQNLAASCPELTEQAKRITETLRVQQVLYYRVPELHRAFFPPRLPQIPTSSCALPQAR